MSIRTDLGRPGFLEGGTVPSPASLLAAVRNRHDFVMMATGLIWFRRDRMQLLSVADPRKQGDLRIR